MPSFLRLHFEPDTDGTGELFAQVQHDVFAGAGSAWFGHEEVRYIWCSASRYLPNPKRNGGFAARRVLE